MLEELKSKELAVRWTISLLLLAGFVFINWPFITPVILAAIFAFGLNDLIEKIKGKIKWRHNRVVLCTLLLGLALFWTPITLAIYRVIFHINQPQTVETDRILTQVNALKEFLVHGLHQISTWTGVDLATPARGVLENILKKTGELILNFSSQILSQLPAIALSSFVFILMLFFFLLKNQTIKQTTLKFSPLAEELTENLISVLKKSCSLTLFSTLVVGLIQASLIGLASLIFGEGDFWLVLTITFLVSFIPVIGAAPMGYLLAILAFLGDRMGSAAGLAIVATIAGSVDNFLKPLMMSGENNVSPLIGFTCVVGAIIMLGLPGLIIGPVLMNLFVGIVPALIKAR